MKGRPNERGALTRFLATEESDYPIRSERYIAFERAATSFLCKQDFILLMLYIELSLKIAALYSHLLNEG